MVANFFEKVSLSISKVKPYKGFIFLCGGPTDVRSPQPISIRDAIHRELVRHDHISPRIRVAEDYKDWSHESIYSDLLFFERHLAELSSVIVLVLESAGSIAELGLFTGVEEFQKKLLIFIETSHYKAESFIKLGPIDYLEKTLGNSAQCHQWAVGRSIFDAKLASELQPELAEAIIERDKTPQPEHLFRPASWLDIALLICDIIHVGSALTLREIKNALDTLGINKKENELRQILFLLQKVNLVVMEPKGDLRFFVSIVDDLFYKFSFKNQERVDTVRAISDIVAKYNVHDKKRIRVIQSVRARNAT